MHNLLQEPLVSKSASRCPYLGLTEDPQTSLGFPSEWNYCQHARPTGPVRLEYQGVFCMTANHVFCSAFKANKLTKLPPEIRLRRSSRAQYGWLIGLVLGIGVLVALLWFLGRNGSWPPALPWAFITSPVSAASPTLTVPTKSHLGFQPLVASSGTRVGSSLEAALSLQTATFTVAPAVTPSPLGQCVSHDLETPFGSEVKLVIHRVHGGESMDMYAATYSTSVKTIIALNYHLTIPIQHDSVIVIAPGKTQPPAVPPFEALQIAKTSRTLQSLAADFSVTPEQLSAYNDFDPGCSMVTGWLLVPRGNIATP